VTEPFTKWYRADDIGIRGALVRGGLAIAGGATLLLLTGLSDRLHFTDAVRIVCTIAGSAGLLFGLVTGFVTLPRFLFSDHYIALGESSLHLSLRSGQEAVPWGDIERIFEKNGELVIQRKEAEPHIIARTFDGKSPRELAPLLEHARLRAVMGIASD
jgi:hypothetical protein